MTLIFIEQYTRENLYAEPIKLPPQKVKPASEEKSIEKVAEPVNAAPGNEIILGVGGGYFRANGDMGAILKGNLAGKIFVQGNNLADSIAGIGLETGYSYLKDREWVGGIRYIPTVFYFSLNFPLFSIDLQPRLGLGFTVLMSRIDTNDGIVKNTNADFTFYCGIALMKSFKHFVIGIEGVAYYLFEENSSSAMGAYLVMGYKF